METKKEITQIHNEKNKPDKIRCWIQEMQVGYRNACIQHSDVEGFTKMPLRFYECGWWCGMATGSPIMILTSIKWKESIYMGVPLKNLWSY